MGNKKRIYTKINLPAQIKIMSKKQRKMKTLQNIIQEVILNGLNEGLH